MPDMSRLLDIFEQQMMHVVSVHEVSQGQVPGRVEAAKAIELLQSSDKGRYKHLLDTIDQSISIGWWQSLMLARQFETPEKMVMTYSREGVPMVKRWRKGAADPGTRIRVVRMGGLGRTRAERQDSLLLLWQNHVITDPDVMAELMEVPIPSSPTPRRTTCALRAPRTRRWPRAIRSSLVAGRTTPSTSASTTSTVRRRSSGCWAPMNARSSSGTLATAQAAPASAGA
jgi:hypothetical protein